MKQSEAILSLQLEVKRERTARRNLENELNRVRAEFMRVCQEAIDSTDPISILYPHTAKGKAESIWAEVKGQEVNYD